MEYKNKKHINFSTAWILRFTFRAILFITVLVLFMLSIDSALSQIPNEIIVKLTVEVRDVLFHIPVNDVQVTAIYVDNASYRVPLSRVGDGVYEGYLREGLYNISIDGKIVTESLYLHRDTKLTIQWVSNITVAITTTLFIASIFLALFSPEIDEVTKMVFMIVALFIGMFLGINIYTKQYLIESTLFLFAYSLIVNIFLSVHLLYKARKRKRKDIGEKKERIVKELEELLKR